MNDVWILIEKTLLDSLWASAQVKPVPDNAKLLSHAAVRGFWKDKVSGDTYEVVNVLRDGRAEIDEFIAFHSADILAVYGWTQGTGVDNDSDVDGYPTIPQGVLDVMKDHVTYDVNGDVVSTTPATFENPNWGHVFLGQKERVFAGEFSLEFSREFF